MTRTTKGKTAAKPKARKLSTKPESEVNEKSTNSRTRFNFGFLPILVITASLVMIAAWSQNNATTKQLPVTLAPPQTDPLAARSEPPQQGQRASSSQSTNAPGNLHVADSSNKPSVLPAAPSQQPLAAPASLQPTNTVPADSSVATESDEVTTPAPQSMDRPVTLLGQVVHDLVSNALGPLLPVRL